MRLRIEKLNENSFILHGKMKEISDYQDLKLLLEKFRKAKNSEGIVVHFDIPQARDINPYILGYWLKLARKDGFKIHLYIISPLLYNNLLRLGMHTFLEIKNDSMELYL